MRSLLILVFMLTLIPVAHAQEPPVAQTRAVVCHHREMNVRAEPDIDSDSLGMIAPGTYLTVLEKDRDDYRGYPWTYARVDGTGLEGWVFADYLVYLPMYTTVTAEILNVRAEPWTHAAKIAEFTQGEQLEVLGREKIYGNGGLWYFVRNFATGVQGWVKGISSFWKGDTNFMRFEEVCGELVPVLAEATPATPLAATIWGYNPLELHATDSQESEIIAYLRNGTRVNILQVYEVNGDNNQYWTLLEVVGTGLRGWYFNNTLYSDALLTFPLAVSPASQVNIRSAAGTQAAIIGTLGDNACVQVTDSTRINDEAWFYSAEAGGWFIGEYASPCF